MLFMSVPPHQGDEWVLLISCVRDICWFLWQLPSGNCPFTDSGKTERGREAARNNEAWDQLAWQENGFSAIDAPLDDCVGLTRVTGRVWEGREESGRRDNKGCSIPLASPSVYAKTKNWICTLERQKLRKGAFQEDTAGGRQRSHGVNNFEEGFAAQCKQLMFNAQERPISSHAGSPILPVPRASPSCHPS